MRIDLTDAKILLCACTLSLCGMTWAEKTWVVDHDALAGGDGSEKAPFQTIQAAINAAGANDTIMVKPGTYDSGETQDAMSDGKNLSRVLITKPLWVLRAYWPFRRAPARAMNSFSWGRPGTRCFRTTVRPTDVRWNRGPAQTVDFSTEVSKNEGMQV